MIIDNIQNITPNIINIPDTPMFEKNPQQEKIEPLKRKAEYILDGYKDLIKKVKTTQEPKSSGQNNSLAHLLKWRDQIKKINYQLESGSYKQIVVQSILQADLNLHAQNLQAIYLNIDWKNENNPNGLTTQEFKKLQISDKILNNGMVFVWADKQNMNEIMDHLETMGIIYVEIFSFILISTEKIKTFTGSQKKQVKKERSILDFFKKKQKIEENKTQVIKPQKNYFEMPSYQFPNIDPVQLFSNQNYPYFKKAKKNLLMLRKINKKQTLELRHQRTSDVYFTLYDQKNHSIDEKGFECIYKMIETLLIKANYSKGESLKMMELWAKQNKPRKGWISISEKNM